MKVVEIFSKNCLSCDYMFRLQNRLDIYNDIIHYELGSLEARRFKTSSVPTFFIFSDDELIEKIENPERKDLEKIKALLY